MKPVRFGAEASAELREAVAWYAEHGKHLAKRLLAEVRRQADLIRRHPKSCAKLDEEWGGPVFRRAACRSFPYVLIFRETDEAIEILAVAHTSRLPGYWLDRA